MNAPTRLGLYSVALAAIFAVCFVAARAVVPDGAAARWTEAADAQEMDHGGDHGDDNATDPTVPGSASSQDGYRISEVSAPTAVSEDAPLSFTLTEPDGAPVTEYDVAHEKQLHLVVVRSDGAEFRHVHPTDNGDGTWSLPWRWNAAGSYRLFVDFVPTSAGTNIIVKSTVSVAGDLVPRPTAAERTAASIDGFTVELAGDVHSGGESNLTFTVARDGRPVTNLQPYLGAYGHLVALRADDLGYLHVHPTGAPGDGRTKPGPAVDFVAETPTPGKYFLYLDFQVDGTVRTAEFVVTAQPAH